MSFWDRQYIIPAQYVRREEAEIVTMAWHGSCVETTIKTDSKIYVDLIEENTYPTVLKILSLKARR